MNGFVVQLCVLAVLGLALLVAARRFSERGEQRRSLTGAHGACADRERDTILVLIVAPPGAEAAAARALHSAFDRASCPFRVSVAVHEEAGPPEAASPVMAAYADLATGGRYGRSFSDQVTALRAVAGRPGGARHALLSHALRGHAYVATLSPGAELVAGWDDLAVGQLSACGPRAALVAPPAEAPVPASSPWDAAAAVFAGAHAPGNARFPVFARFSRSGVPLLASRPFARPPLDPAPALFWQGDCTFAPAAAAFAAFFSPAPDPPAGEDAVVSSRLHGARWSLFSPGRALAFAQPGADLGRVAQAARRALLADQRRAQAAAQLDARARRELSAAAAWAAAAGLDVAGRVGSGRARMGLLPDPDEREVVAKCGSVTAFRAERAGYA